ncbi:MAG: CDP-diacylglycerol--glycerol-3-phosphate 3-phosphatidyltransferase [Thermodesulfobacteriota bacterium]|nr:CDP-diacylglycerol--glycerol-3-phosphate 3-phosphatidyltransferase [Thermodesulfobacteriota bacterium]
MNISFIKKSLQDPNILTLSRIAASPLIVILLLFPMNRFSMFLAALVFSAAAITDYLDGFFARKYGQVSNFGKAMDPLADKFLMSSAFIMLSAKGLIPGWMVCVIVARELGITGMRTILVEKGADISASIWGKLKTVFQIAALIPLLLHYRYFSIDWHTVGTALLWVAVILTVISAINYFLAARKFLEN